MAAASTGVYIPLYSGLWSDERRRLWQQVIDAKSRHPRVRFLVAINPDNGPGSSQNPAFVEWTGRLRAAGIEDVLGYIPTNYGREPQCLKAACEMVDRYASWYPNVNGIMLDEMSSDAGKVSFYRQVEAYARRKGMTFIKGNPGTFAPEDYVAIMDNLSIVEGSVCPIREMLAIKTFGGKYPKSRFSVILHSLPILNEDFVKMAKEYVGYMYVTDDSGANPYNALPSYFERLLELLEAE